MVMIRTKTKIKVSQFNQLRMADVSPEKAGVGGSSPSLATTFSIAYKWPGTWVNIRRNNKGTLKRFPGLVSALVLASSFHISRAVLPVFAI